MWCKSKFLQILPKYFSTNWLLRFEYQEWAFFTGRELADEFNVALVSSKHAAKEIGSKWKRPLYALSVGINPLESSNPSRISRDCPWRFVRGTVTLLTTFSRCWLLSFHGRKGGSWRQSWWCDNFWTLMNRITWIACFAQHDNTRGEW